MMLKRFIAAVVLAVGLCACQETKPSDSTLIAGTGNVKVLDTRFIASGDSTATLAGGTATYVVVRAELTNDTQATLYPVPSHFYLQDRNGRRLSAVDSGSSAFAGISNNVTPLKAGEKRELTVGFRADPNASGTVGYEY